MLNLFVRCYSLTKYTQVISSENSWSTRQIMGNNYNLFKVVMVGILSINTRDIYLSTTLINNYWECIERVIYLHFSEVFVFST